VVRRKIDLGEALAALGAVLLLVSLFLDWYEGVTGWEAFETLDLVVLLAALAVLAAVAGAFDWLGARLLAPLGLLLLLIVVVQLVEPPPAVIDLDLETGAWLAVAGAALVLLGGALRTASVSITVNVGGKDARRRVPAVDRRQDASPTAPPAPAVDEPTQATQPFSALEDPPPSP
jgi:peptidoglycan/LPS O-acetylase OafA/YrhL